MLKICCLPETPAIDSLTPEEKRRFGLLVHMLRKSGHDLRKAQEMAYQRVLGESVDDVGNQYGLYF
ncbi:MAG: hypothetical protein PHD01_06080 [Geobacteraceae bacterium]|nr:hypothetical protein [Geobacteraceae bacterium]